ncbi:MAG: DUF4124 domain-containing protein [Pseudomonadota bacterium]
MQTQAILAKTSRLTVTSLLLCCLSAPLAAETYRWIDANGVVNYAEQKPRGIPSEQVTVLGDSKPKSRPPVATASAATSSASNTLATPTRSAAQRTDELSDEQQAMLERLQTQELERQATMAQIRQQNCDKSRQVLANLTVRDRIRVNMPDGTQRALPEEERQERIRQAQEGIVRNCNS